MELKKVTLSKKIMLLLKIRIYNMYFKNYQFITIIKLNRLFIM